ncbi:MAG: LapA family protein [Candidatus Omnitrophota bacterium]|nr:MAG: LapA family protein [Candidatus Omnitrophota bacterium]
MNWKFIMISVLLLLLVIFTAQNYEVVNISFLFWSFKTSRALIILASLLIGVAVGWIISFTLEQRTR